MLVWGAGGVGKTVLLCTAPKPILVLMFDPDGEASILPSPDIHIVRMHQLPTSVTAQLSKLDGSIYKEISSTIVEKGIQTLICDSLTEFASQALMQGVIVTKTMAKGGTAPTIEAPGMQSYGIRTRYMELLFHNLLTTTARTGTHCLFTAHIKNKYKRADKMGDEPELIGQTISLGGDLPTNALRYLSECWYMDRQPRTGRRTIYLAPTLIPGTAREIQPMKTRMFSDKLRKFLWDYDQETGIGATLDKWHQQWKREGKIKSP
jgi:hypothetical protein